MIFKNPGTKWPILISLGILGVITLSINTILFAMKNPVEMSDYGMQKYQDYDNNANSIINAQIEFDNVFDINLTTPQLSEKGSVLEYKITTKDGVAVDNAKLEIVYTRPESAKYSIDTTVETVDDGVYTTVATDLDKVGRWDILTKIEIDGYSRYYNVKSDTRKIMHIEF